MSKSRKPTSKAPETSVHAEGRSVAIGGDVVNSTIVIGDNVHIRSGRSPLGAERISELTEQYKRAVEREWSVLRVNEAEIPLKDVFVMLQAVASPPPINLEKRPELAELPERMKHAGFEPKDVQPVPVELSQALKEARHLVLLGEPGSGKSTTLQFIGLCFVHENWAEDRLHLTEQRIPIKLDLRGYADILAEPGTAMEEALSRAAQELLRNISNDDAYELIRTWRENSQLLILLDGLDEVSDQQRGFVRDEIHKFAAWAVDQQCRFVVSSRLTGYPAIGGKFKEFTLKPFEQADEAIPYLGSWLSVLRSDWGQGQVKEEAINLHERMANQPALKRVLDNPLLLRISAQVYVREGQIASNRADLYRRYTEELWLRAIERGVERAKKDEVWKTIEDLAWKLQTNSIPDLSTEMEIILREKIGLVVRVGERLAFSHITLQEYFVAKWLARAWQVNRAGAWAFLCPRLHIAAWHEPLLLLCGSLDSESASNFVSRVLNAHSQYEHHLYRDRLLAATLIGENGNVIASVRRIAIDYLLQLIRDKNQSHALMWSAADALGTMQAIEAIPDLVNLLKYKDRDIPRAAGIALKGIRGKDVVAILLHTLNNENTTVRKAAIEALAERHVTNAVPILLQALKHEDREVCWTAAYALGKMQAIEAVPELIQLLTDQDQDRCKAATQALAEMHIAEAVPGLLQALKHEESDVRWRAANALGKMQAIEAIPDLVNLLKSEDRDKSQMATYALGEMQAPEVLPILIQALQDKDEVARHHAAKLLGKIKAGLPVLIQALKDEKAYVRLAAAKVFAEEEIKPVEAIPALIQVLKDERAEVHRTATTALSAEGRSPSEAWPAIIEAMDDTKTKFHAGFALARMRVTEAVTDLLQALKHEDYSLRWMAAKGLGEMQALEAIPGLINALKDEDSLVRMETAISLGKIRALDAVPALVKALNDEVHYENRSFNVYVELMHALGKTGGTEALSVLLRILRDRNPAKRRVAVFALGEMQSTEVMPALFRALKDKDTQKSAVVVLTKVIIRRPIPDNTKELREQAALLRKFIFEANYADVPAVAERISMLEAAASPYQDPFEPVIISIVQRIKQRFSF